MGRALEAHYRPIRLNLEMLLRQSETEHDTLPEGDVQRDAAALRGVLR